jgi:hypothetical protein
VICLSAITVSLDTTIVFDFLPSSIIYKIVCLFRNRFHPIPQQALGFYSSRVSSFSSSSPLGGSFILSFSRSQINSGSISFFLVPHSQYFLGFKHWILSVVTPGFYLREYVCMNLGSCGLYVLWLGCGHVFVVGLLNSLFTSNFRSPIVVVLFTYSWLRIPRTMNYIELKDLEGSQSTHQALRRTCRFN